MKNKLPINIYRYSKMVGIIADEKELDEKILAIFKIDKSHGTEHLTINSLEKEEEKRLINAYVICDLLRGKSEDTTYYKDRLEPKLLKAAADLLVPDLLLKEIIYELESEDLNTLARNFEVPDYIMEEKLKIQLGGKIK